MPTDEEVDDRIFGILKVALKQITQGEADLLELDFYEEKPTPMTLKLENGKVLLEVKEDDEGGEFHRIPYTKVPTTHKLKFHLKLAHNLSQREATVVGSAQHKGKTLEHSERIEVPELESLPDESNAPHHGQNEREMKADKMHWIVSIIMRLVEALVSLINALINSGAWFK